MCDIGGVTDRLVTILPTREPGGTFSIQLLAAMETERCIQPKPGEPILVWLKDYDKAKRT